MGGTRWGKICGGLLLMVLCVGSPEASAESDSPAGRVAPDSAAGPTVRGGTTERAAPEGAAGRTARGSAAGRTTRDDAMGRTMPDYERLLGELEAAGALQFYDNTEDILRLAQFERALMRFRFLKGQVQGMVDYRPLVVQIDRRLHFLKKQLRLTDWEVAAIPRRKAKGLKPRVTEAPPTSKPVPPPPARGPGEAKAKEEIVTTDTPPSLAPPTTPSKPPAAGLPPVGVVIEAPLAKPPDKPAEKAKTEKEQPKETAEVEDTKPKPKPNIWQKFRQRFPWAKKAETEEKAETEKE